jgi:CDP-diacylglycerol--glycerol-3-phosphate 3-phosphatidyltransferase
MMARLLRVPLIDLLPLVALMAYTVPAFVVFLVRADGVARPSRLDQVPRSPYLPRVLMEFGYWVFAQPVGICRRLGIPAHAVTIASLVVTIGASVALGAGLFGVGGWVLLLAFALDAWDGILARQTGTASVEGEFLDAIVDRYNDLIVFLGLLWYYRGEPLPSLLAALALIGSTLTSYTRAKGEACGVDPNVGSMQRHERALYLGLGTLLAPLCAGLLEPHAAHPHYHLTVATLGLIAVASNWTAIVRARYVWRGLRSR